VIDDALGDEVRVTVIAAGFDGGQPPSKNRDKALGSHTSKDDPASTGTFGSDPDDRPSFGGLGSVTPRESDPEPVGESTGAGRDSLPPTVPPARPYQDSQAEELDVPDFLK
jgi:cell division protein FtsZ